MRGRRGEASCEGEEGRGLMRGGGGERPHVRGRRGEASCEGERGEGSCEGEEGRGLM